MSIPDNPAPMMTTSVSTVIGSSPLVVGSSVVVTGDLLVMLVLPSCDEHGRERSESAEVDEKSGPRVQPRERWKVSRVVRPLIERPQYPPRPSGVSSSRTNPTGVPL